MAEKTPRVHTDILNVLNIKQRKQNKVSFARRPEMLRDEMDDLAESEASAGRGVGSQKHNKD
jgi:hypothetical protein